MDQQTTGTVISVAKQWWLKVNRKPVRMDALDGATFPYIIKVEYTVEGITYVKRKWINAGEAVPCVGDNVLLMYCSNKPSKAKIL
ncbi:MAG: sugar ABC transporter permease [Oscillospiraceae bacterium]|nr:sugar ABC transporter permease [Oscillospiraceae bacterium]